MSKRVSLEIYVALLDEFIIALAISIIIMIVLRGYGIVSWKLFASITATIVIVGTLLFLAIVKVYKRGPQVGREAIIGALGEALTDIKNEGFVLVEGEIWRARSKDLEVIIKKGEKVKVISLDGLTLIVEKVE